MSLLDNICFKTKVATVSFILGKMTFIPSVCLLFSNQRDLALTSICVYAFLIATSLVFSIAASRSKRIDTSMLNKEIKLSDKEQSIFTVVVKDGKVVAINQGDV